MPGDYSSRFKVTWDCGHTTNEVERSNAYQRSLDIAYMKPLVPTYQGVMGRCAACRAAGRA